jgi:hypothetical protein
VRTLNAGGQALLDRALAGEQIPMAQLVEILYTPAPQRLTAAGVPIVFGGYTWQPDIVGASAIAHDGTGLPSLEIVLPGATEAQIALGLDDAIEGAAVRVLEGFVDPDTGAMPDALELWRGTVATREIVDGPSATVTLRCEHRGVRALRRKPTRYTNEQQQRLYAGDTSLDVDPMTDAPPLVWPAAAYFRQPE